jgi:PAS domain S-box-containing protein
MRKFRLWTVLLGAIVATSGVGLITFNLWRSYNVDIRDAERATRNLTVALEAHTRRTVQAIDLTLAAIVARPETAAALKAGNRKPGQDGNALEALMTTQLSGLPQLLWLTVFDAQGRVVATTSAPGAALTTVAGADYFEALRPAEAKDRTFTGPPSRGRASGRWFFSMTRRLTLPDGGFAGVVLAGVRPDFFAGLYRNIDIGLRGNITLFHQDGTIVARWPAHEDFIGRSAAAGALFREHLPKADSGTTRLRTVLENREILFSYSRVMGTPFVINVAFELDEVLDEWKRSLAIYATVALGIVLLVVFAVLMVLRNRRRIETEREQSQATLRALFDNASEGMLLADAQAGQFHSSNPAMRRMLGYSESELMRLRPPDIHLAEARAGIEEQFAAMARGELRALSAVPTLRKDGSVFYADISALQISFGGRHYIAGLFRDVTAIREAQEALKQERDFARSLTDTAPVIVLLLDPHGGIRHVNPYFEQLTGYRLDEIRGKEWFSSFVPARDRDRIRELFQTATRGVPTRGNINPIVTRSGEEREIEWDDQPLRDSEGRVTGLLAIGQDVTARRKMERALRISEERLNEAQRIAQIGSWELDLVNGKLDWSDEIFRLFEIDRTKFGATYEAFLNAIHPEDREAVNAAYTRSLETRESYAITHRLLMADGRIKYVHERCESEFDAQGKPLRSMGTVQDVTERKRAEQQTQRLSNILEGSLNEIYVFDADSLRFVFVNQGARTNLGYTMEELVALTPLDLKPEYSPESFAALMAPLCTGAQRLIRFSTVHRRKDGSMYPVEVHLQMFSDESPPVFVAVIIDITAQRRAEDGIRQLNTELEQRVKERTAQLQAANRELETFTYSVSHDLKAPLRGIDGYSRLLLEEYSDKLDDEGRQFLHNVRQAAQQMGALINDLLAYSRLERRELHTAQVDLQPLIQTLLDGRAEDIKLRGAAVSMTVPVISVSADREGLTMALRNLLENALKFTRDTPDPSIEIGARDTADACILSVRDNGVGFDMKFHDKIFTIFQRLHRAEDYPGTGVGLAIVKKAMERMRGRVWAESELGKGATFYLEIPK